jgi:hypothetical protein
MVLIYCVVVFIGAVQAGLWDPALLNADFETPDTGGTWSQNVNDWYKQSWWGSFVEDEGGGGIPDTPYGLQWGGVAADAMFQQIGTFDGDWDLSVSSLLGHRANNPQGDVTISIWIGGDVTVLDDYDPLSDGGTYYTLGDVGATQVDSVTLLDPYTGSPGTEDVTTLAGTLKTGTSGTVGTPLWIQIETTGKVWVDNITIDGTPANKALLVYPTPSGTDYVPVDAYLEWGSPPITPNYYDLWFGDPNVLSPLGWTKKLDKQNQTEYDPPNGPGSGNMAFKTTYYWRVDAYEPNTVGEILREGNLWSFTTVPDYPIILSQPQSVTVAASDTAVITVGGLNLTTAQWYKDGGIMTGETSTTLTIGPPVLIGDEAAYHCVVGDGNPAKDVLSASARLWTKRLIGHWEFEDDLTDEVGDWPGTFVDPNTDPPLRPVPVAVYESNGVYGKALELSGIGIVLISDSNEFFNFYPLGYTVSAWVKNPNAGWGALAGKQNRGRTPDRGWVLNHNGDTAHSTMRQTAVHDYGANVGLMDGDWHIVTGVFDPISTNDKQIKCYVDGQLVANSGIEVISGITGSVAHMVIGAEGPDGASPLTGLLDDVRLYSYNLPSFEVLGLYGTPIISEHPVNQTISAGLTATLTVSAYSNPVVPETGGYEWYKDDVAVSGGKYSGWDSNTLTISDFQVSEEGAYYCVVGNGDPAKNVASEAAFLRTERLVGHWKLDDASGTTADDSSPSSPPNTGTVKGTDDGPPAWTTGNDGGALSFNGIPEPNEYTDYVDCGSHFSLKPTAQVTVSAWYNTAEYTYYGQIAGFAFDSGASESGYSIMTELDGYIGFWITGSSGVGDYLWTSDVPAVPTGWTHVAGTYDGTTMKLYVNGAEKATSTDQSGDIDYDHVNSFKVGLYQAEAWWLPYAGDIDDVRVYNYGRTASQILSDYGKPIITEQPVNQTISAGLTATLSVSAYGSPAVPETGYVWYKDDVPVSGGKYSGEDSNTLTIGDFQVGEEGAYYCDVTNSNDTVTSEAANLILPQLVSHWTFDTGDNLTDTVGSNDGSAFGADGPTYDPSGIVGDQAIVLDGTEPNDVVVVPYAYGLNSTQFTVTLWAKVAGGSETWRSPLCSRSEGGGHTRGFNLYASMYDTWQFWSGNIGGYLWDSTGSAPVVEGEWVFLVATYDATTLVKQLYVNGELDGEQTLTTPIPLNPSPNALQIGGNGYSDSVTGALFNGSIDDVKVYGYVLDAYDIAEEYVGIVPTASVCPDKITGLDYDYDGDCDVDIADFALFAAKWDNCNRVAGVSSGLFNCN